ncbi:MAG: class I SAM-dependent methyltransferase [Deltaproteobacteria bacterium]|nr:class I SAM-dependent methyltransferase [Deltaproteobacteria bacterium]
MTKNKDKSTRIREFWDSRASLNEKAGTRDLILNRLEIDIIMKYIHDGMSVLDVGCGNGITAIEIAKQYAVNVTGFDFSPDMVKQAESRAQKEKLPGRILFLQGDILDMPSFHQKFDVIYSKRALINLSDWETQKKAIISISGLLSDNGAYLMCENSQDGLDAINDLREQLELPLIEPPWHNRYFRDAELEGLSVSNLVLEKIEYFTSTYYFLSRVVNAWLSYKEGKEPRYDAPVNQLALSLPSIGNHGQTRLWVWRKIDGT